MFSKLVAKYFNYCLIILILIFGLRFYETSYIALKHSFSFELIKYECLGLFYDLVLFSIIISFIALIHFSIGYWNLLLASIIWKTVVISSLVIYLICIHYFLDTLIPLDQVVFSYNFGDLINIAKVSTEFNFTILIPFLTMGIIIYLIVFPPFVLNVSKKIVFCFFGLIFVGLIISRSWIPEVSNFSSTRNFYFTNNKLSLFIYKCIKGSQAPSGEETDFKVLESDIKKYWSLDPQNEYISLEYPLMKKNKEASNLHSFFKFQKEKPNIVIIIVESLSASIVGPDAILGSYTPFLDSLIQESLYWPNCLSSSERTINALPSILASVPYGREGFMAMAGNMPDHYSLTRILHKNDYKHSFFYGGEGTFDNINGYISSECFDFIKTGTFINKPDGNSYWGIEDDELFTKSFRYIDSLNFEPRIDLYLTLSMHGPFNTPNKNYYESKLKLLLNKYKKDIEGKKKEVTMATLFFDDALRAFFSEYKKRNDFNNSIFVIVGDHTHSFLTDFSKIEKYHVPLIIYSPLLKSKKKFESIVSHLDICPSLLSMLKIEYNIKIPENNHWLGTELDTSKTFSNHENIALMNIGRKVEDFIYKDYCISEGEIFKFKTKLSTEALQNDSLKAIYSQYLNAFNTINTYVCYSNKITTKDNFFFTEKTHLIKNLGLSLKKDDSISMFINLQRFNCLQGKANYKFILNGKVKLADADPNKLPKVVMEVYDQNHKNISYKIIDFRSINNLPLKSNTWCDLNCSQSSGLVSPLPKGSTALVYIWNPANNPVHFKDIFLKIYEETY